MGFTTGDIPTAHVRTYVVKTQNCPQMLVLTTSHTHTHIHMLIMLFMDTSVETPTHFIFPTSETSCGKIYIHVMG